MQPLNILVACERSGVMRDALRARGHRAVSCDLKPSRVAGPHIQDDVRNHLHHPWDMLIAHPVCRYLTNAGAKHLYIGTRKENGPDPERWRLMAEGAAFFRLFDSGQEVQHIPLRAVENPIPHGHAVRLMGRPADQYVQPWWFGSPFSKATGWWLTRLPLLPQEFTKADYPPGAIKQAVWRMGPSPDREEKRSQTDPQIARACAQYWTPQLTNT